MSRPTLKKLAENLIREYNSPFKAEDFFTQLEARWSKKISRSTATRLKRSLSDHECLIEIDAQDFIPYSAVFEKIGHLPLAVQPGRLELEKRIFIPGHRLIPYLPNDREEGEITLLDPLGAPLPKKKTNFLIEQVIHYYQYCGARHFPTDIVFNEYVPGKSSLTITVWELGGLVSRYLKSPGDGWQVRLVDYDLGVFRLEPYPASQRRLDLLRMRSLNVAMEEALNRLCQDDTFCLGGLQKQLLRVLFFLNEEVLSAPAFSLTDFLESLKGLNLVGREGEGVFLVPAARSHPAAVVCEESPRIPRGAMGTLDEIFLDLGLAITGEEFRAILYTIMSSNNFRIEAIFDLLFGGEGKLFYSKKQHDVFYTHLRTMLHEICEELKSPESRLVADLRKQTVSVKLGLIGVLRFLEKNEVGLKDLPMELLEQVADLDHFCRETLKEFARRSPPPEVKFLRDTRMALKIIGPHMAELEDDVFYRLGIY